MSEGKLPPPWLPIAVIALVVAGILGAAGGATIGLEEATPTVLWALLLLGMIGLTVALLNMGPDTSEPEGPEAWLCKHCLRPYVPGAHFCPRCGAPQTFFAGTAQYETIYAQAWCLGKAGHHPSRAIHVWGLALIFLFTLGRLVVWAFYWVQHSLERADRSFFTVDIDFYLLEVVHFALVELVIVYAIGRLLIRSIANLRPDEDVEEGSPREIDYGSPPWWTHDAEWALPEFVDEDDEVGEEPLS